MGGWGSTAVGHPRRALRGWPARGDHGWRHHLPGFRITSYNVCYTKLLRVQYQSDGPRTGKDGGLGELSLTQAQDHRADQARVPWPGEK